MRAVGARDVELVEGSVPLLLLAPHGGRRDASRRPWSHGGLRTNDLQTAEVARELAGRLRATALVNATLDRNDVDLNRLSTAHERAPWFLEALADLLDAEVRRHGRVVVLAIHGWNVVQPVIDLGVGFRPGRHAPDHPPGPTASLRFVAGGLRRLADALAPHGVATALGARYPARGRENLLQLFTTRHLDDARPLVRRLAALGRRCDAVQLELGLPVRLPGPWRDGLALALEESLPMLLDPPDDDRLEPAPAAAPAALAAIGIEFVADGCCGLVAFDPAGGRLLLFEDAGTLALFTGERLGIERGERQVGALRLESAPGGMRRLRYAGPLLRFPDTMPFLDLEAGLARARLTMARIELAFAPPHDAACPFGPVEGEVTLDGRSTRIAGFAAHDDGEALGRHGRRLAVRLGAAEHLLLRLGAGTASGFLCRTGAHVAVDAADLTRHAVGASLEVAVRLADGAQRTFRADEVHRLPVVRGATTPPVRVEFAALRLAGSAAWAGWAFSGPGAPDA